MLFENIYANIQSKNIPREYLFLEHYKKPQTCLDNTAVLSWTDFSSTKQQQLKCSPQNNSDLVFLIVGFFIMKNYISRNMKNTGSWREEREKKNKLILANSSSADNNTTSHLTPVILTYSIPDSALHRYHNDITTPFFIYFFQQDTKTWNLHKNCWNMIKPTHHLWTSNPMARFFDILLKPTVQTPPTTFSHTFVEVQACSNFLKCYSHKNIFLQD